MGTYTSEPIHHHNYIYMSKFNTFFSKTTCTFPQLMHNYTIVHICTHYYIVRGNAYAFMYLIHIILVVPRSHTQYTHMYISMCVYIYILHALIHVHTTSCTLNTRISI